ncbi:MAG: site-2 protease family protein [Chloroflexi bacterium]|nr:site-2 protease family protein [Chloroflexota bacterium]
MDSEHTDAGVGNSDSANQLVVVGLLRRELAGLMRIHIHQIITPPDQAIVFRGQIDGDTGTAFDEITKRFARHNYTALLRRGADGSHEVYATRGLLTSQKPSNPVVNLVLFLATAFVVLYIGAGYAIQDAGLVTDATDPSIILLPLRYIHLGLPFAGTLLGILLAHELSHFFVARRHGSPVSLPYFIPMPNILGTMGAVIVQRAPMRSRKSLFDIGVAGPLGGLIVAIPLLVIGLSLSSVGLPPAGTESAIQEGNSLLYLALKYLVFGEILPNSSGADVWLHPVAFAAWAGLLVTAINLIPVGQLDGGHISYAILGNRARMLGRLTIAAMALWGGWLMLSGNEAGGFWLLWALLNLVLNRQHPAPLDDVTPIGTNRLALGLVMIAIFVLTFMPAPLREVRFDAPDSPQTTRSTAAVLTPPSEIGRGMPETARRVFIDAPAIGVADADEQVALWTDA